MSEIVITEDAYESWSLEMLADAANEAATTAERQQKSSVQHAVTSGKMLLRAKARCAHGEWSSWLEDHWSQSPERARVFMRLAKAPTGSLDLFGTVEEARDSTAAKRSSTTVLESTTLTAADVPPKDPNETPLTQPSIRKTTPETTKQTETQNSGREVPATTQSTPAQESQPTSTGERAEAPDTQDDADALILQALDLIGQKIDAAVNRKQLAAKLKRLVNKLDPPTKFVPPELGEVEAFAESKQWHGFDAEGFLDHYELAGWKYGKARTPITDWQRAASGAWRRGSGWAASSSNERVPF